MKYDIAQNRSGDYAGPLSEIKEIIKCRLFWNIHELHYFSYEIGFIFKWIMEGCHSIDCAKYVAILSYTNLVLHVNKKLRI